MSNLKLPQATTKRLPLYYRYLEKTQAAAIQRVSSQEISNGLQIDSATIRRDFSLLGELGRKGYGYDVAKLLSFLKELLKKDEITKVVLLGVGNLGTALLNYNLYKQENTMIVAGFDTDPNKIGKTVNGVPIYALEQLTKVIQQSAVQVAIITVPVLQAQAVADRLLLAGIKGILNFTPTRISVPDDVRVHYIDLTVELQTLIYLLKTEN